MSWLSDLINHKHKWQWIARFCPFEEERELDVFNCSCSKLAYVEDHNSILTHWMYHNIDCDCPWCEMFQPE